MMGIPRMNPAAMLAGAMGGSAALGWVGYLMIGVVLALINAIASPHLPGSPAARGALYGLFPWIVATIAVMPMMGMGVFGGSAVPAIGGLIGHPVYGATLGSVYGQPDPAAQTGLSTRENRQRRRLRRWMKQSADSIR